MVISLGHEYAGIFANDDTLAADLLAAGEASNNKLWRFPLSPAYDKLIDSPIADMKNIGPREGGSITAAQFLKRYVEDGVAWARSEEHTSELQSLMRISYAVFCLKKKTRIQELSSKQTDRSTPTLYHNTHAPK